MSCSEVVELISRSEHKLDLLIQRRTTKPVTSGVKSSVQRPNHETRQKKSCSHEQMNKDNSNVEVESSSLKFYPNLTVL